MISILLTLGIAAAAPMKPSGLMPASEALHAMLSEPLEIRIRKAKELPDSSVRELEMIAFSEAESLQDRWRAITVLGRVHPEKSKPILEKALQSKEWYMRNAAITVLNYNDRAWSVKWLRMMLHDPALIVRTSAVEAISQMGAIETQDLLWEKLYSGENYKGGKSLWIRKHIAQALVKFSGPEHETRFGKLLYDNDESLRPIALLALKKMGSVMGEGTVPQLKSEN